MPIKMMVSKMSAFFFISFVSIVSLLVLFNIMSKVILNTYQEKQNALKHRGSAYMFSCFFSTLFVRDIYISKNSHFFH